MKIYLTDRQMIAEDTAGFWFNPEKPLRFVAGQFGEFQLENPSKTDSKGNARTFSLASDPASDQIMIATRLRDSAFKSSLWSAALGDAVRFMGPVGRFTLHQDPDRLAVFLAGGIGITPVRSITAQAVREGMRRRLIVLYSNRTRAAAAFHDDFHRWSRESPNLDYVPTLTAERPAGWSGELTTIDEPMIRRHVSDPGSALYYVVGPPGFVSAMKSLLRSMKLDDSQIKSEDFAGY